MRLLNIDWLRPIAVILIVVNHVFAIYSGVWEAPWSGINYDVDVYKWIQRIAICCSLQLFTFISGYIYGSQISNKGTLGLKQLAQKKAKRLLYPYFLFGTLYYLIISSKGHVNFIDLFSALANGMGHLWFLPTLFLCFILHWVFYKMELFLKCKLYNKQIATIIIMTMLFCTYIGSSIMPKIFCIKSAFMYLIFFYIGQKSYGKITLKPSALLFSAIAYICLFVIYYSIKDIESITIPYFINKIIDFLTRLCGIYFFFILSLNAVKSKKCLSKFYKQLTSLSFGIYIYHQFIILYIYERTIIPELCGVYWTPFICLTITMIVSYILSTLSQKIPIIKEII